MLDYSNKLYYANKLLEDAKSMSNALREIFGLGLCDSAKALKKLTNGNDFPKAMLINSNESILLVETKCGKMKFYDFTLKEIYKEE